MAEPGTHYYKRHNTGKDSLWLRNWDVQVLRWHVSWVLGNREDCSSTWS